MVTEKERNPREKNGFQLLQKANEFSKWTDDLYVRGRVSVRIREKYIRPLDDLVEGMCIKIYDANKLYHSRPPEIGDGMDKYTSEKLYRQTRREAVTLCYQARNDLKMIATRWKRILGEENGKTGYPVIKGIVPELTRKRRFVFEQIAEIDRMLASWYSWMNGRQ